MTEEGQRIEFDDKGPYLFQVLDTEVGAMLLEEHDVCLLQFGGLYLPVSLKACGPMAEALVNMSQASMGPEREGMSPVEFDLSETTELPLVTGSGSESFQHGDIVYVDVFFGETEGRLCFSVPVAAAVGQILSQVSA